MASSLILGYQCYMIHNLFDVLTTIRRLCVSHLSRTSVRLATAPQSCRVSRVPSLWSRRRLYKRHRTCHFFCFYFFESTNIFFSGGGGRFGTLLDAFSRGCVLLDYVGDSSMVCCLGCSKILDRCVNIVVFQCGARKHVPQTKHS